MTVYHVDDRVTWFDPLLLHLVAGTVLSARVATPRQALVSLDDRMIPVTVHPDDLSRIQPIPAVTA